MAGLVTTHTIRKRDGKPTAYRVRLTIPKHLRAICKRDHGQAVEFVKSLETLSPREAAKRSPAIIAEFKARIAAAQAEHGGLTTHLSDREVSALCGRWLAERETTADENIPESLATYQEHIEFLADVVREDEGGSAFDFNDAAAFLRDDLARLLGSQGLHVTPETRRRLVRRLTPVALQHYMDLADRLRTGRWQRTITPADFPSVSMGRDAPSPTASPTTTLDALLAGWGLDRGWRLDQKPIPRALYDRVRTVERLAEFLGHRDASKITKAEAVRWKAEMLGRKLTAATVRNDMSEMSALWRWGEANGLPIGENPFVGTLPPKAAKPAKDVRAFTDAEAVAILRAARQAKGYLRWVPWVLCCTGARLNEVAQAAKTDVFEVEGVPVIRIHDEGEGLSVKNSDSRRTVPLHPALVTEGFLDYVAALPLGSALWPDMKPDTQFGRRSGTGGKRLARWLRETVGITDTRVSPSHSWRHTFIERCRRVVMPLEVRSALTGHSAKLDESAGYGAGFGTMVEVLAEYLGNVKMPDV